MVRGWLFLMTVVGAALLPAFAQAQISRAADVKENRAFVYHGKLVRPDGSAPTGSMSVTLKILSPDPKLCVLWSETQTVEMKDGGFSVELGHNVHRLPGASGGAASSFKQAFINNPSLTISSAQCASGNSYTPTVSDDRLLAATFNDSGSVIEIAGMPIKSVPFALQAEEIGGYGLANLVKISGAGNNATLSPAEVDEMKLLANTSLPVDLKGRLAKNAADPVDPQDLVTKAYYQANLPTGTGVGSVTNVSVGGVPLSVTNGSTTPLISIAQANATTSGYLTSANWNTFNDKLTSALATGQVFIGNASNVATAGYFGIGQMRNSVGALQMPTACAASQTLTWSAVTDVLACSNIDGLNANKITAGTIASARLGTGTADATTYLRGDGAWVAIPAGADHLGNHTATQNLNLAAFQLVGNGGSSGISIASGGNVGIGTTTPGAKLDVAGTINATAMTINGVPVSAGGGDNMGTHTATQNLNLATYKLVGNGGSAGINISSAGNVGIGTASPANQLSIVGPNTAGLSLATFESPDTWFTGIEFKNSTSGARNFSLGTVGSGQATAGSFQIVDTSGGGARVTVDTYGSVGIGTVTPSEKLEVAGKVKGTQLCIGTDCRAAWPAAGGSGTVTSVGVSGLPLSVTSASTTPQISITQANTTTAGYLASTDWNTFNNKLGTALAQDQVWVGNGSNVAAPKLLRISDVKANTTGNPSFLNATGACSAGNTLGYNSVTDRLECQAFSLTSSQVTTALGFTPANNTAAVLKGGNAGTFSLGTTDANPLSIIANNSAAVTVLSGGNVGIGTTSPVALLEVGGGTRIGRTNIGSAFEDHLTVLSSGGTAFQGGMIFANQSTAAGNKGIKFTQAYSVSSPVLRIGEVDLTSTNTFNRDYLYLTAGNVGIGTTSPVFKLDILQANNAYGVMTSDGSTRVGLGVSSGTQGIVGTQTNHDLQVRTNNLTRMTVDSSGNVGIGTASPASKLEVAGVIHSTSGGIKFPDGSTLTTASGAAGGSSFTLCTNENTDGDGLDDKAACVAAKTANGAGTTSYRPMNCTVASGSYGARSGDALYWTGTKWQFRLHDGSWNDCDDGSLLVASYNSETISYWSQSGSTISYTAGSVGIGTTSPAYPLELVDSASASVNASSLHTSTPNAKYRMTFPGLSNTPYGEMQLFAPTGAGSEYLRWNIRNSSGTSLSDVMVINRLGNVGIGTTTPGAKLEVNGAVSLRAPSVSVGVVTVYNTGGTRIADMGSTNSAGYLNLYSSGGAVQMSINADTGGATKPGGGSWAATSDAREKILKGHYKYGLREIGKLSTVNYSYRPGNKSGHKTEPVYAGFVAQEVMCDRETLQYDEEMNVVHCDPLIPEAVRFNSARGVYEFDMHYVNMATVNAVQELGARVRSLEEQNRELRDENSRIREDLEKIKRRLGL